MTRFSHQVSGFDFSRAASSGSALTTVAARITSSAVKAVASGPSAASRKRSRVIR